MLNEQTKVNKGANVTSNERKKPKTKIFFTLFGVFFVITIISAILWGHFSLKYHNLSMRSGLEIPEIKYKLGNISYEQYKEEEKKEELESELRYAFATSTFVSGGITIVLLGVSVTLKIIEKRGNNENK